MNSFQKYLRIYLPIILSLVLIAGIFIGAFLYIIQNKTFIYQEPNKLTSVINYIANEYVDTVNKSELIESTIPLMLSELDPHSIYIPAKDVEKVNEPLNGNFEGIGVQFKIQYDTIAVVKAIPNGPSFKVGIKDGDRIVKINDTLVAGVHIKENDVMKKLRGKKGTKVVVSIKRKGLSGMIDFTITRDKIPLYSVDIAYMVDDSIGYIKINSFSQTTYREFENAIRKLKEKNESKLIIDLRGNTGGFLDAATNIADEFLKDGKVIVFTKGRARRKSIIYSTSRGLCEDDDVIILIDEWAASASEILAGAIQDNDRGIIVGRRSFGKGLVQEQTMFNDGSSLRLTIARYYTPTGRCIQKSYKAGIKNYNNDLNLRFAHGEFEEKDSIHFSDSLKYTTPKGKIVYGGGGIMPDIFVPLDTSGTSNYLSLVSRKGLIYQFAFNYADKNRKKLFKYKNSETIYNYLLKNNPFNEFIDFADKEGVKRNNEEIEISRIIIRNELFALIARNILDNEGFYPILLRRDKTFEKAVELLRK